MYRKRDLITYRVIIFIKMVMSDPNYDFLTASLTWTLWASIKCRWQHAVQGEEVCSMLPVPHDHYVSPSYVTIIYIYWHFNDQRWWHLPWPSQFLCFFITQGYIYCTAIPVPCVVSSLGLFRDGFALTTLPSTSRGTEVQVQSTASERREENNADWLAHKLTSALLITWANLGD